jgi:hypothetical protein
MLRRGDREASSLLDIADCVEHPTNPAMKLRKKDGSNQQHDNREQRITTYWATCRG